MSAASGVSVASATSEGAVRLLVLNGPGLGDLRDFDGNSYGGGISLADIRAACAELCGRLGMAMDFRQTDDEDEMFRWISKDSGEFDALVVNPIGYSRAASVEFEMYRSSIKQLVRLNKPVIEVHISNIFQEGAEITKPLQSPEGDMGFICGLGVDSYLLAIHAVVDKMKKAS